MSNGHEERLTALADWSWPEKYGPKTDPINMFRLIEWYPPLRDQLVKTRLHTVATVFGKQAEIDIAYAEAAKQVLEQLGNVK